MIYFLKKSFYDWTWNFYRAVQCSLLTGMINSWEKQEVKARTGLSMAAALSIAGPYVGLNEGWERVFESGVFPDSPVTHCLPFLQKILWSVLSHMGSCHLDTGTFSLTGPSSVKRNGRGIFWQIRGRRSRGRGEVCLLRHLLPSHCSFSFPSFMVIYKAWYAEIHRAEFEHWHGPYWVSFSLF